MLSLQKYVKVTFHCKNKSIAIKAYFKAKQICKNLEFAAL